MKKTPHYKVGVSELCRQMLANHVRFMALKSPSAARNVKNELLTSIRSLHQIPERFPFLEAEFIPPNKYHKMVVDKRYLVLYQIRDQIAFVDYIVDCRQDYSWLIR